MYKNVQRVSSSLDLLNFVKKCTVSARFGSVLFRSVSLSFLSFRPGAKPNFCLFVCLFVGWLVGPSSLVSLPLQDNDRDGAPLVLVDGLGMKTGQFDLVSDRRELSNNLLGLCHKLFETGGRAAQKVRHDHVLSFLGVLGLAAVAAVVIAAQESRRLHAEVGKAKLVGLVDVGGVTDGKGALLNVKDGIVLRNPVLGHHEWRDGRKGLDVAPDGFVKVSLLFAAAAGIEARLGKEGLELVDKVGVDGIVRGRRGRGRRLAGVNVVDRSRRGGSTGRWGSEFGRGHAADLNDDRGVGRPSGEDPLSLVFPQVEVDFSLLFFLLQFLELLLGRLFSVLGVQVGAVHGHYPILFVALSIELFVQLFQGIIRHQIPCGSAGIVDGLDDGVKDVEILAQFVVGGNDQDLGLSQGDPVVLVLSLFFHEGLLVLRVRLPQLPGLLDLSKNVGQDHGRVLGRLADVADLLAAERVGISALGLGQGVGDPFFRVGEDRPDVVVGLWVPLDVVVQFRRGGGGGCRQCRRPRRSVAWYEGVDDDGGCGGEQNAECRGKGIGNFHCCVRYCTKNILLI
mmetsp:Transcript_20828/g.49065  ORF Transcript_20828/g.49065 Transcript_20828/m.49065 type:complete len:566 (+) Transcript_20828:44-1741(+)